MVLAITPLAATAADDPSLKKLPGCRTQNFTEYVTSDSQCGVAPV